MQRWWRIYECQGTFFESVRQQLRLRRGDFADAFYDNLASQSAEIGPMFAQTDMNKQNELLRLGIESLIDFAAQRPDVERELHRLGEIHDRNHLAIRPELYPLWLNALLETVRDIDADCTPEIETAWKSVVTPGIDLILSMY